MREKRVDQHHAIEWVGVSITAGRGEWKRTGDCKGPSRYLHSRDGSRRYRAALHKSSSAAKRGRNRIDTRSRAGEPVARSPIPRPQDEPRRTQWIGLDQHLQHCSLGAAEVDQIIRDGEDPDDFVPSAAASGSAPSQGIPERVADHRGAENRLRTASP